jgi:methylmalonyl-CoA/ethylmalonyl-CoA epimerase
MTGRDATVIDHAGIATDNAAELAALYTGIFECSVAHRETFDGMEVVFLGFEHSYLELLEPREGGPIASYLDDNGPGIHHLAVATPDIESALARARDQGVGLIDEEPRPGAWGHDVAFIHPKSTGGVLFEFVQH